MRAFYVGFEPGQPPVRIRLGAGIRREVGAEMDALGFNRALVLTTPEQATEGEALGAALKGKASGLFSGAVMHTPVEVTEAALKAAEGVDCLVAMGGGLSLIHI